jgi:hypothetical protein
VNAFYRFMVALGCWLIGVAAAVSVLAGFYRDAAICTAACAGLVILWESAARSADRREQMRTYREAVWERRIS